MPPPLRVRDRFSRPICCPWPGTTAPAGGWQQSHLFAGEYWDQDSQLLYLRARWYDPQIGRFISADPFEGRQRDPRSLNRYSYAHGDPVHGSDPTGRMTLGEVGTTLSNIGSMATRAYNAYDFVNSLVAPDMDQDSDNASEKPTIWDSIMAMTVSALDPSSFATAGASTLLAAVGGTEEHHAIPIYMCGGRNQKPLVQISHADHVIIHWLLNATTVSVTVLGNSLHYALSKRNVSRTRPIMRYIARTPAGRGAILGTLTKFYDGTGYMQHGVGGDTIGDALKRYGPVFVTSRASTSWSNKCMR